MYHKRVVIVPYNKYSKSARNLRDLLRTSLNIPVIYVPKNSTTYQPRWSDYVINWGCSTDWDWINETEKTPWIDVTNKLKFFEKITYGHNKLFPKVFVNIPEWTTDPIIAYAWGKPYFARTILNGHSGNGIISYEGGIVPNKAPLYVQYKKKKHEYRVHFAKDVGNTYSTIDITQKKKRKGFENVNTQIRNHKNGWVYAREDIYIPDDLTTQALNAAWASNLPFGAVDLIWNEFENKCYVLEINSAPGLEGTTLQKYNDFFVQDITK